MTFHLEKMSSDIGSGAVGGQVGEHRLGDLSPKKTSSSPKKKTFLHNRCFLKQEVDQPSSLRVQSAPIVTDGA